MLNINYKEYGNNINKYCSNSFKDYFDSKEFCINSLCKECCKLLENGINQ